MDVNVRVTLAGREACVCDAVPAIVLAWIVSLVVHVLHVDNGECLP